MTRTHVRFGLAGVVLFAGCVGAQAQDAIASAAKGAPACSGFMCLFSSHKTEAPVTKPQPAAPVSIEPRLSAPEPVAEPAPRTVKPAPTLTVAAGSAEIAKLKGSRALFPKMHIRFVDTELAAPLKKGVTDLQVSTAVDDHGAKVKLFAEQLHVVAGGSIRSMTDLNGKLVSFGPADGATAVAARHAFQALGITVRETPLDVANASDGLASGDIDALVVLAPSPARQIGALRSPGLHLVSWPDDGAVPSGARIAALTADAYPRLIEPGRSVRTLSLEAVLTSSAKAAKQPEVRRFLAMLGQRSAASAGRDHSRPDSHTDRVLASSGDLR